VALDNCANDDSIRVLTLTGAGRGFCAGANLSTGGGAVSSSTAFLQPQLETPQKSGKHHQRDPNEPQNFLYSILSSTMSYQRKLFSRILPVGTFKA